jgi:RNA polymerase sigma factor (sigma-70 family)
MNTEFDTLSIYVSLAKKTISKFAPRFYNGLAKEMLANEEAVSDVATAIMYADWRFDPERSGKTGLKKTLYSYRNQCAIWAIKTYVTHKYKNKNKKSLSLDNNLSSIEEHVNAYDLLASSSEKDPLEKIIEKEEQQEVSKNITQLLDNANISEKQKQQIMMYYFDNLTLSKIGKHFGVSREAVRQSIKRAIETIKTYDQMYS